MGLWLNSPRRAGRLRRTKRSGTFGWTMFFEANIVKPGDGEQGSIHAVKYARLNNLLIRGGVNG